MGEHRPGLFAAMLGFCLLAVIAHERRGPHWIAFAACAAGRLAATAVFSRVVRPDVHVG